MSDSEPQFKSFGKYKVLGEIGQGAMGVVYRAHDSVLDREVAIKTISAAVGADDELRRRFHREAQAAGRLNHPNIITIYEYGEAQGRIYIAMELLDGTDLKELMLQGALRTFDEQLAVMEQVMDGLAFAHSKQIVHRDLKPSNIHILPNGQVKILDFGLARLGTSELTQTGIVMGTPNYMSPEQVLGDRIDARSDIFSIGTVFYEMLCGYKPFESESMHGVLFQVVHKDPPSISQRVEGLPPVLVQVVERCLAKEKERRFQNALELRDAVATVRQAFAGGRLADIALDAETGRVYYEGEVVEDQPAGQAWPAGGAGQTMKPQRLSAPSSVPPSARVPTPAWVEGTVALDRQPEGRPPRRNADTLSGRSRTRAPGVAHPVPRSSRWSLWVGLGAMAAAALVAVLLVFFSVQRSGDGAADQPEAAEDLRLDALTRALVRTQIDLARSHLAGKKYREALTSTAEALSLDPANVEARQLQEEAQRAVAEVDSVAQQAQERAASGQMGEASVALARLLELDPSHPVASQLSAQLNESFRARAEEARQAMATSQRRALSDGARTREEFLSGQRLADQAVASLAAGEFAEATRGFLESRDAFDRAGRAAVAERQPPEPEPVVVARRPTPAPVVRPNAARPAPPASAQQVAPPAAQTSAPAPAVVRRGLVSRSTQNESGKKGPSGFEGAANPDFMGEIQFDTPAQIGAGDVYTFKVFLTNVGRKRMKLRGLEGETRLNRDPVPLGVELLTDSVEVGETQQIAEIAGTWPPGVETWSLDVRVLGDQGDSTSNRLVLRPAN